MPAAAVIPAPIAYIKVVAVKKLVVGSGVRVGGLPLRVCTAVPGSTCRCVLRCSSLSATEAGMFTLKKLECSKQAFVPE